MYSSADIVGTDQWLCYCSVPFIKTAMQYIYIYCIYIYGLCDGLSLFRLIRLLYNTFFYFSVHSPDLSVFYLRHNSPQEMKENLNNIVPNGLVNVVCGLPQLVLILYLFSKETPFRLPFGGHGIPRIRPKIRPRGSGQVDRES